MTTDATPGAPGVLGQPLAPLRVGADRRSLVREDGAAFFWLGDTAWELTHRLTREEIDHYLADRAARDFTVIQTVALTQYGADAPNAYGDVVLPDGDPARPSERYVAHLDYTIDRAAALGLYVALVPTWGNHVVGGRWPRLIDATGARAYGEFLGARYRDRPNLIWIAGGDQHVIAGGVDHSPVWRALVAGLKAGDGGAHLTTFHPPGGGYSSSGWFHLDDWLDFNMIQSGQRRDFPNYVRVEQDYALTPPKPVLDGEPCYERAHPNQMTQNARITPYEVRKCAYWALFAGALGHTYGCLEVWQLFDPARGHPPRNGAELPWREALGLPGARQMRHLRALMELRACAPRVGRIPDRRIVLSDYGSGPERIRATRAADGSNAMVYSPGGRPVTVGLSALAGDSAACWWYDPRTGEALSIGEYAATGGREFVPPGSGWDQDWVLVLDDAARGFPPPGVAG